MLGVGDNCANLDFSQRHLTHCKLRGIIYFRMEIQPPFRHAHQQIFLMKVELFWCSWMKGRLLQLHTLMSRLWNVEKNLFLFWNTKIIQLSWEISSGAFGGGWISILKKIMPHILQWTGHSCTYLRNFWFCRIFFHAKLTPATATTVFENPKGPPFGC